MDTLTIERVEARSVVDCAGGCIVWTGYTRDGYGHLIEGIGRTRAAHRIVWEHHHGPIPAGYHVHHTCHYRRCVNVDHLQAMSKQEHARLHGLERGRLH